MNIWKMNKQNHRQGIPKTGIIAVVNSIDLSAKEANGEWKSRELQRMKEQVRL